MDALDQSIKRLHEVVGDIRRIKGTQVDMMQMLERLRHQIGDDDGVLHAVLEIIEGETGSLYAQGTCPQASADAALAEAQRVGKRLNTWREDEIAEAMARDRTWQAAIQDRVSEIMEEMFPERFDAHGESMGRVYRPPAVTIKLRVPEKCLAPYEPGEYRLQDGYGGPGHVMQAMRDKARGEG